MNARLAPATAPWPGRKQQKDDDGAWTAAGGEVLGAVVQCGQDDRHRGAAHAGRPRYRVDVARRIGAGQSRTTTRPSPAARARRGTPAATPMPRDTQGQDSCPALRTSHGHGAPPPAPASSRSTATRGRLARGGGHPPAGLAEPAQVHRSAGVRERVPARHDQDQRVPHQRGRNCSNPSPVLGRWPVPVVDPGHPPDLTPSGPSSVLIPLRLPKQQGQPRVVPAGCGASAGREGGRGGGNAATETRPVGSALVARTGPPRPLPPGPGSVRRGAASRTPASVSSADRAVRFEQDHARLAFQGSQLLGQPRTGCSPGRPRWGGDSPPAGEFLQQTAAGADPA